MVELGKGTKRSRSQDSKETFKRSTSLSTSSTKDSWRIRSSENELAFVSVAPRNEIRTCAGVGVTLRERERENVCVSNERRVCPSFGRPLGARPNRK